MAATGDTSGTLATTVIEPVAAGAVALQEGLFSYHKDTDVPYVSTGISGRKELITETTITEYAQDAVGAMVDASLVYVDATPLLSRAALTGDVTASQGSNATTIANNAVTLAKIADANVSFAKIQDVTGPVLLGRYTAGLGDLEEVGYGTSLVISTGDLQRAALTGDVTAAQDVNATTIANDAVTFAKMQNITSDRLLGRDTAASGNVEELTVGSGIEFSGSTGIISSSRVLNTQAANVYIVSSAAETTIYSYAMPAATMGATDAVRISLAGTYYNNTGVARGFQIKFKIGATTVFDITTGTARYASAAVVKPYKFDILIKNINNAAVNDIFMEGRISTVGGTFGTLTTAGAGYTWTTAQEMFLISNNAAGAFNTANALTLTVTSTLSFSSASHIMNATSGFTELLST